AYRWRQKEKLLASRLLCSQIHRKKPNGGPLPRHTAHANAHKSEIHSAVEHVLARQKGQMGPFVRNIGISRARTMRPLAAGARHEAYRSIHVHSTEVQIGRRKRAFKLANGRPVSLEPIQVVLSHD